MRFFGRQDELKKLEGIYGSGKFECIIVHGRLRVGKTALLREFVKDKKSVFFTAQETNSIGNLADLSRLINATLGFKEDLNQKPNSFRDAFDRIFQSAINERIVFILDDYQFLTAAEGGISETLCSLIDIWHSESKLTLIICGSSESVMESHALGFDSPFHGRRTAQIKLLPFTFFEVKQYYNKFSPFDAAVIYGVTGGVPKYLDFMNPELPIEENIRRAFFDPSSYLFEEPANLLRREVRDPANYNAVLGAIAAGNIRNSVIASTVGLETSAATAYLKNLITFGLVGRYTPVTEKAGRKTIYEIDDMFFRFWYRFIPENMSEIKAGMVEKIWRKVASDIPSFMSQVFEGICREWLQQRNASGRLPVDCVEIGRWWGADPVLKTETTIPIVAYSADDRVVFGDCVWSDEQAGADELASLVERSRLLRYANCYYYLFSRSGFTGECAEMAQHFGANLVMFE